MASWKFRPQHGLLVVVLLLLLTFLGLSFLRPIKAQPVTYSFSPVADAYVSSAFPTTNFGTDPLLSVDVSPTVRSYLTITVENITGTVTSASLRIFANSTNPTGFTVHRVSDSTWTEMGIVYSNAPALDLTTSGASGPLVAGTWYTINITPLISGNGTYSIGLKTRSKTDLGLGSRESANPPQLIVEEETDPGPTPTAASTPAPSPSPGGSKTPSLCGVGNFAWTKTNVLARGAQPTVAQVACLKQNGFTTFIRQNPETANNTSESAEQAAVEASPPATYIGLYKIPNDTVYSPVMLDAMMDDVVARLAQGEKILVHDAAGRGRMGFWDATYLLWDGYGTAAQTIEDRYLAKALPFLGAKIGCQAGGNGQVQVLAEISQLLTGITYFPQVDEYGTTWANCVRPAYMNGWDYSTITWPAH